jgi:hypothetical protein
MVADPDAGLVLPVEQPVPVDDDVSESGRRVVAVAVSPMELLRPDSDLVRMIAGAGSVDLLLACEDEPVDDPSPVGVIGGGVLDDDLTDDDYDDEPDEPDAVDEVRAAADLLGLDDVRVHRLGLRLPLGTKDDADLVAALSELIGFDPDPGVTCLAPAPSAGDVDRSAVDRAVRRIVQVYGLPLQRYRCLELAVVDD